jgi:peptidoglycan/LPS O-acetylase OafA/YrhL
MSRGSPLLPAALSILAGAASWELARRLGGHREAWDDPLYWQIGYPLLLLAAFLLGMVWRDRPWRWAALMMAGQAVSSLALALYDGGVPNLLPLGLMMFALLGLPCVLAAYAGKWVVERALA